MSPPRIRVILRACALLGIAAVVFHLAHGQLGLGGHALDTFTEDWLYDALILGAAASCCARAWLVRVDRLPWLVLGVGLALDATGEIYYSVAFGDSGNPPIPSLADLFYLLYYPASYVGLVLLVRQRIEGFRASTWLDGAIAATTAAAVVAALVFERIVHSATHGGPAAVATNLAYPVGDLVLLAIVVGMFSLAGWRAGRAWLLLAIGLGMSAIADTGYAYSVADGSYVVGGILDSLWLISALLLGFAAWQPVDAKTNLRVNPDKLLVIPIAFAVISLALLSYGGFFHVGAIGLILAGLSVLLVIVRAAWTFRENAILLKASELEAVTDELTGLGNRRQMHAELNDALAAGGEAPSAVLLMFDLNGFKLYNDQFGHLAGDTMLAHLGRRLRNAVAGVGSAFRLGGDEFCVLLRCPPRAAGRHVAAVSEALTSSGEGFSVTASHGLVEIPDEAQSVTYALRLADNRMYSQKGSRRGSARQQTQDVLLGLLREREPQLHDHLRQVGRLAELVACELGLSEEEVEDVGRAAELHDIGKAAIPDAILNKPGPLSDHEWTFMQRHTEMGERILTAAPALSSVAALVRSSHERCDGRGYPDGLRREEIPLGSRIIGVCDAFDAMTSARPYAKARRPTAALAELRRGAGSQFDPQVLEAFIRVWHEEQRREQLRPRAGHEVTAVGA